MITDTSLITALSESGLKLYAIEKMAKIPKGTLTAVKCGRRPMPVKHKPELVKVFKRFKVVYNP